jgi:two-component system, chemotaxis family, sensor kinase CheA
MDDFADTLWNEFAVETDEHLQAVEPILVQSDLAQIGAADIAQLFRSFHSVKGLSRAMDVAGMESIAHHAENLLGLVRDGRAALTQATAELLLHTVDALKRLREAVAERRADAPAEPELIARLAAAFAAAGGTMEAAAAQLPPPADRTIGSGLHEEPEMLAIFAEMLQARGPELCAALADDPGERGGALETAETLAHAAEVMNFEGLSADSAGLGEALRRVQEFTVLTEPVRQELLSRLADIRLRIGLVEELSGKESSAAAFSAALVRRIGDEPRRLAEALAALNQRLRDDLGEGDHLAAEADAAAMVRSARALQALAAALSLPRTAQAMLLVEDICGRIASGELESPDAVLDAAGALFGQILGRATASGILDLEDTQAAELVERLRTPLLSIGQRALQAGGRLVAGLRLPAELLTVLSDENLAELERGIAGDGLLPYEVLVHLEADVEIANRLMDWLGAEARTITNRTVLTHGESWFEMLVLSPLRPDALSRELQRLDPGRQCVKLVRRLTDTAGGEPVLAEPGPVERGGGAARPGASANLIRVRGEVVDALLDDVGELRVRAATLSHLVRGIGSRAFMARTRSFADRLSPELRREFLALVRDARDRDRRLLESEEGIAGMLSRLHQSALELRVVPIDLVFNRLPRLLRDLAQHQGKSVELALEGRDVRIDKSMVDLLADPLIHMVRNAVDHGIEPPSERRAAGKPERAHLTLRAEQRGAEIRIEVADDGRGLDAAAIRANAVARGLVPAAKAAALADHEIFQFIFEPGLSTAATITETSGRGVGMDIVLAIVRRLNGNVSIRSERGRGTMFTLVLPVSAALQTALIVRVGDQSLAIPERHVMAVADIAADAISLVGSHRSILHREALLPLYGLGRLLGMDDGAATAKRLREPVVVTGNGRQMIGLEVDAIEQRQELFLRDLDPRLASFPGVGGASVLGDGRIVLVLDGDELLQIAARGIERTVESAGGMVP